MLLYAVTIFLSAFLLFQVQPLIGRFLLPWFGGTPAVWTTCLLAFQSLLFGGYLYADALTRLPPARQKRIHVALLAAPVVLLALGALLDGAPLEPPGAWKPAGSSWPALRILGLLAATAGLPYFALSATGPLLQAWAARLPEPERVWRLFALSNLGSLLALLAYPFAVEPELPLTIQAWAWSALFALFAAACTVAASRQARAGTLPSSDPPVDPGPPPAGADRRFWIAFAACGSILLMATTNQMCQEVAVVPFLWVLPLSLYLLSFVLCFEAPRFPWRTVASLLFVLSLVPLGLVQAKGVSVPIELQVGTYALTLFAGCLVCHGELYRLRPAPSGLTGFYLRVAGGGALGGILVAVVAPVVFSGYWEYPIGLLLCGALLIAALLRDPGTPPARSLWIRTAGIALWLTAAVALVWQARHSGENTIASTRNFYGVLQIREELPGDPEWHLWGLMHGQTRHGFQYRSRAKRRQPTSYYGEESGVGRALLHHPRREDGGPLRIGVVGLGVGTLAAYVKPGDCIRFYEVNPSVISLSSGSDPRFTFLSDAPGRVEVVEGDARLSLERELRAGRPGRFDLLVLDAFTSDAIPAHLLTAEAFETYLAHLSGEDAILAVHVSNRHLTLQPVLVQVARRFGLAAVESDTTPPGHAYGRSVWVLMSRRADVLKRPGIVEASTDLTGHGRSVPLWTDDYCNLFRIVNW